MYGEMERTMFKRYSAGLALLLLAAASAIGGCSRSDPPAPAQFKVVFQTTKGDVTIDVTRAWSPRGADRFYTLVKDGFYDGARFFRVIRSPRLFMAQFGINGDPKVTSKWMDANIKDDPVTQHNTRGMISFATSGPNTRSTQLFINYSDNSRLDAAGFSPFAVVSSGMDVADQFYSDYGEGPPDGSGPDQERIEKEGNAYLDSAFPKLDYIRTAKIVESK
jgi:cyclophilin family peptidyl-prolyl cis-trans isomerase